MKRSEVFFFSILILFGASCTSTKKTVSQLSTGHIKGLRFINEYVVPNDMRFKGTVVGGLSGIDRDVKNDLYYIIVDDRADRSPVRFYKAKIFISSKGI